MDTELMKFVADIGLGAMSFALFLRLGKVVANHEVRIGVLERHPKLRIAGRRKR